MRTLAAFVALAAILAPASAQTIRTLPVPDGGIQPQAVMAADGTLHLLYYKGDPQAGDLFYVTRAPGKTDFSAPIRVNSQSGSAIAIGNDRGGQIALGKNNRPHIAWNGSGKAEPKGPKSPAFSAENPSNGVPMLYTRLNEKGDAFEPQRNVITSSFGLDGGGSIAADDHGGVFVVWHADPLGAAGKSESERRVFLARSLDDGVTFAPEAPVSKPDLGACGCCGLKALAVPDGPIHILFRSARTISDRDMILLSSRDGGTSFIPGKPQPWPTATCPMSTCALVVNKSSLPPWHHCLALAWETKGEVFLGVRDCDQTVGQFEYPERASPPGTPGKRRFPAIAAAKNGQILLAWTEDMTWGTSGTAFWQLFGAHLRPVDGIWGQAGPVPPWSLVAAVAEPDGSFDVLY